MESYRLKLIQALNATAASLQSSAQSETEVYRAYKREVAQLGLRGAIALLDESGEIAHIVALAIPPILEKTMLNLERLTGYRIEGHSLSTTKIDVYRDVIRTRQAVYLPNSSTVIRQMIPDGLLSMSKTIIKAIRLPPTIYAPLISKQKLIGVVNVAGANLTEEDVPTLQAFANHIASALENARLFTELQNELAARENLIKELEEKNAQAETLREGAAAVALSLNLDETVSRVLDQLQRVVPYDSASVQLLKGSELEIAGGRGFPEGRDAIGMRFVFNEQDPAYPILRHGLPYVIYPDIQKAGCNFKGLLGENIRSWMAIPLRVRGRLIGLFALDGDSFDQFTEAHARFASTFANQVAVTLENARLFSDLQSEFKIKQDLVAELEAKNTELERFTYTVSHDLKSPLVTINGFLGLLEEDAVGGDMERFKLDSQRIHQAVKKMHLLLNELIELSRIGRMMNPSQTIPFKDVVCEALELVHGQIVANGVMVQTQPDLPVIYGDRQRLVEVLQNLIDNAAKFMGGQTDPRIEIGQRGEQDGKPVFYVKDNGPGIAPEYHERVFGLFNKLDPRAQGTGIGLALVKRIIEFHGGRIWIESDGNGRGAAFYFTLPPPPAANRAE